MNRCVFSLLVCAALSAASFPAQQPDWDSRYQLGEQAREQGRFTDAEEILKPTCEQARAFGKQDLRLGKCLVSLGQVYRARLNFSDAEKAYKGGLKVYERALSKQHREVAPVLDLLAELASVKRIPAGLPGAAGYSGDSRPHSGRPSYAGQYEPNQPYGTGTEVQPPQRQNSGASQIQKLSRRSVAIREKQFGPQSMEVADTLLLYARLLARVNSEKESRKLYERSAAIRATLPRS